MKLVLCELCNVLGFLLNLFIIYLRHIYNKSFNTYNCKTKACYRHFYNWRNRDLNRLSNLTKLIQLVHDKIKIHSQSPCSFWCSKLAMGRPLWKQGPKYDILKCIITFYQKLTKSCSIYMSLLLPGHFHQDTHDTVSSTRAKQGEYKGRKSIIFNCLLVLSWI